MKLISGIKNFKESLSITKSTDIKYRGPLDYVFLRLIGWLFIALSMLSIVFNVGSVLTPQQGDLFSKLSKFFAAFNLLSFPLFLLANFSVILSSREKVRDVFLKQGILALIVGSAIVFAILHFIISPVSRLSLTTFDESIRAVNNFILKNGTFGLSSNVFVDLTLCAGIYYFFAYAPKAKCFEGKNIIWFRLLIILPIIYSLIGQLLKALVYFDITFVPFYLYPFLPSKSFLCIIAFFLIVLLMQRKKRKFLKNGGTLEEYLKYTNTNKNSLSFSIITSIVFLAISLVDLVFFLALSYATSFGGPIFALGLGFGESMALAIAIPFAMLFSYTKPIKSKKLEGMVTLIGIVLVALFLLEGLFEITTHSYMMDLLIQAIKDARENPSEFEW